MCKDLPRIYKPIQIKTLLLKTKPLQSGIMIRTPVLINLILSCLLITGGINGAELHENIKHQAIKVLKKDIIIRADKVLFEKPVTITGILCERSAGGKHDFYSEGDYWWPDPDNPEGPYIQRDGMTNPANFVEHRRMMIRLSQIVGILATAYKITGDEKYVESAFLHLKSWFKTWKSLDHFPVVEEVIRNLPVRNPVIWLN